MKMKEIPNCNIENDANRYDARQNGRKDRSRVLTNLLPAAAAVADVRE